jgi:hypothetical protein
VGQLLLEQQLVESQPVELVVVVALVVQHAHFSCETSGQGQKKMNMKLETTPKERERERQRQRDRERESCKTYGLMFINLHEMRGSWTKASKIATRLSLFSRNMAITYR